MKSPFPGMDPFIEACGLWGDFHHSLIQEIKRKLNQYLPKGYVARTEQREYIVLATTEDEKDYVFIRDVAVGAKEGVSRKDAALATLEPDTDIKPIPARAFIEENFRETFVEIRADTSDKLITCIEILSPSNKRSNSEGWNQYLRKRQGILLGRNSSLVEIDLLRGGLRMPMLDPWPTSPYGVLVARQGSSPGCLIWPAYSLRRLAPTPIPLRKPDADVILDLQLLIDAIYQEDRYESNIDYTKPITPPLSAEESTWLSSQAKVRETPS
jgi:Protein of unknown function (DUF4058)